MSPCNEVEFLGREVRYIFFSQLEAQLGPTDVGIFEYDANVLYSFAIELIMALFMGDKALLSFKHDA